MTKKRTLEMMECVKEFVDSEVLEAVRQRTDKVNITNMAKVEEMEEMAAAAAAAETVAAVKRAARTCIRLCNHVECCRMAFSNGVCSR